MRLHVVESKNSKSLYVIKSVYFKAQCQEWGYKNPLTRLVALFS